MKSRYKASTGRRSTASPYIRRRSKRPNAECSTNPISGTDLPAPMPPPSTAPRRFRAIAVSVASFVLLMAFSTNLPPPGAPPGGALGGRDPLAVARHPGGPRREPHGRRVGRRHGSGPDRRQREQHAPRLPLREERRDGPLPRVRRRRGHESG